MKNIFEVSSLLANLNNLIDQNIYLKDIWIQGEVTDYKGPAYSGHKYFSIKDENSLIKCVFFKFAHIGSDDFLDGDKILINGEIEIYSPAGNLQLKVRSVKKHGLGDLSIEIEAEQLYYIEIQNLVYDSIDFRNSNFLKNQLV